MNQKILVGTVVVVVVLGAGFWFMQRQSQAPMYTGPAEKLTVAVSKLESTTLVRIALERGYFADNGLDVTITEQDLGKFSLKEVFEGRADIATVAEAPLVGNSFKRDDYYSFATIHSSNTNIKIIGLKSQGINVPEDLKGKRVGTTRGTVGEFFLYSFLLNFGLNAADIEVVDKKPPELVEALQSGEIDAFALREPHVFRAKELIGDDAVVFANKNIYTATFNVAAMKDFVQSNPNIVKRFLEALLDAEKFTEENREEAVAIISKDLELDRGYLDSTWEESKFELSLNQTLILTMEDEARWRIQNNLTDAIKVPNYLNYIYTDALEEVKPDAVTIIK